MTHLFVVCRIPVDRTYDGSEAGQTAHYMLRWVNTKGQPGLWSEMASATIPA
jgi:hypothetical protein